MHPEECQQLNCQAQPDQFRYALTLQLTGGTPEMPQAGILRCLSTLFSGQGQPYRAFQRSSDGYNSYSCRIAEAQILGQINGQIIRTFEKGPLP
ncbi:hypothetical protein LAG90_18510 [Marinilongibacter aquaticus]|uniref:hypothetical protein n=1 Tax=Marinilongibacter aquaticus TaxID=2975157 RepID=UPI0021BD6FC8|nr:hypothetical protein [Marinilongibacter aquaticus]UBM58793.1 hypothetical protein LAG90_18510 [Marinilongibacter aquaticus]